MTKITEEMLGKNILDSIKPLIDMSKCFPFDSLLNKQLKNKSFKNERYCI